MSDFVPGLEGVIAFETQIAEPDRAGGSLRYRGVDIEDDQGAVEFAERERASIITTDLALRWATEPEHVQPHSWAQRLGHVRSFACYCSAFETWSRRIATR